jgi:hypothetical protein
VLPLCRRSVDIPLGTIAHSGGKGHRWRSVVTLGGRHEGVSSPQKILRGVQVGEVNLRRVISAAMSLLASSFPATNCIDFVETIN